MLSRISRSATAKSLTINMEDSFNRLAYAVDFERFAVPNGLLHVTRRARLTVGRVCCCSVLEDWQPPCAQEGIHLGKAVVAEFKKKIKEAGLHGTAAHLDLRHGLLHARQVRSATATDSASLWPSLLTRSVLVCVSLCVAVAGRSRCSSSCCPRSRSSRASRCAPKRSPTRYVAPFRV